MYFQCICLVNRFRYKLSNFFNTIIPTLILFPYNLHSYDVFNLHSYDVFISLPKRGLRRESVFSRGHRPIRSSLKNNIKYIYKKLAPTTLPFIPLTNFHSPSQRKKKQKLYAKFRFETDIRYRIILKKINRTKRNRNVSPKETC